MVSLRLPAAAVLAAAMVVGFSAPALAAGKKDNMPRENLFPEINNDRVQVFTLKSGNINEDIGRPNPGECNFLTIGSSQTCYNGKLFFFMEEDIWKIRLLNVDTKSTSYVRLTIELTNDFGGIYPDFQAIPVTNNNIPKLTLTNNNFTVETNLWPELHVVLHDDDLFDPLSGKEWQSRWFITSGKDNQSSLGKIDIELNQWRLKLHPRAAYDYQTLSFQPNWIKSITLQFVPGGIPEPATWAMLIAGFGLIGLRMRRDQRKGQARSPHRLAA